MLQFWRQVFGFTPKLNMPLNVPLYSVSVIIGTAIWRCLIGFALFQVTTKAPLAPSWGCCNLWVAIFFILLSVLDVWLLSTMHCLVPLFKMAYRPEHFALSHLSILRSTPQHWGADLLLDLELFGIVLIIVLTV